MTAGCPTFYDAIWFFWQTGKQRSLPPSAPPPPTTTEIVDVKLNVSQFNLSLSCAVLSLMTLFSTSMGTHVLHVHSTQYMKGILHITVSKYIQLMKIVGYPKYTSYFIMVQSSTSRTLPNMPSINIVANVCCLWLVATTASRSAYSQRTPMKPGWHLYP